jgi:hypothetical protein
MPLTFTLLPIGWTRHSGIAEAIVYSVEGLPPLVEFDQGRLYSSTDEAAAALKAWIEGGEQPTKAGD